MSLWDRYRERLPKDKSKEELDEHFKEVKTEKKDFPAMVIAAFVTFVPLILLIVGIVFGVMWLLFT